MNHNDLNQCRLDVERLRKAADRLEALNRKAADRLEALKAERDKMLVELRFTVEQLKLIATWLGTNSVQHKEMARQRALDTIGMMRGWMK